MNFNNCSLLIGISNPTTSVSTCFNFVLKLGSQNLPRRCDGFLRDIPYDGLGTSAILSLLFFKISLLKFTSNQRICVYVVLCVYLKMQWFIFINIFCMFWYRCMGVCPQNSLWRSFEHAVQFLHASEDEGTVTDTIASSLGYLIGKVQNQTKSHVMACMCRLKPLLHIGYRGIKYGVTERKQVEFHGLRMTWTYNTCVLHLSPCMNIMHTHKRTLFVYQYIHTSIYYPFHIIHWCPCTWKNPRCSAKQLHHSWLAQL